jgi:hypothetical protein
MAGCILLLGLVAGASSPGGAGVPEPGRVEDVRIVVAPEAVRKLIAAAVPYRLGLDMGFFEQVVTLTEPREIRLVSNGLDLKMTATGSPIPFQVEISPAVRLTRQPGGYRIQVESLPVDMGRAGVYDLASYIEPVPVERVTRQFFQTPGREIAMDLIIRSLEVTPDGILIVLATDFP